MKKTKNPVIEFNTKYADIVSELKPIKDQIAKSFNTIKCLADKAEKLYSYSNKNCYVDTKDGIGPIKGIKNLSTKMNILEVLAYNTADDFDNILCLLSEAIKTK